MRAFLNLTKLAFYSSLIIFLASSLENQEFEASSLLQESRANKVVDFGLIYPYLDLKPPTNRSQKVTAGFASTYSFYFLFGKRLGLTTTGYAWFQPVRVGGSEENLYSIGLESGPSFRMLPRSYFDPILSVLGGITATDAGEAVEGKWSPSLTSRLGFNLWRQRQKFSDGELAFHASAQHTRYFSVIPNTFGSNVLVFGLYFRGSF